MNTLGTGNCMDCGMPTSGIRCRKCNGRAIALEAAHTLAERDAEIVRLADEERLSPARLGLRYNISRQAAGNLLKRARARQKLLADATG